MSYLKDAIENGFSMGVYEFYSTSLKSMMQSDPKNIETFKYIISECTNKDNLRLFKQELMSTSIGLDDISYSDFLKVINDGKNNINARFNFRFCGYVSVDVMFLCADILANIDTLMLKKDYVNLENVTKLYNKLKNCICHSSDLIAMKFSRSHNDKILTSLLLLDNIRQCIFPYMYSSEGFSITPIGIIDMYELLFDANKVIDRSLGRYYDDSTSSYCIYGENLNILTENILHSDNVSTEVKEIYIKTTATMYLIFLNWQEYLIDLQLFCKKYYLACLGEYKFKIDDPDKFFNLSDLPRLFLSYADQYLNGFYTYRFSKCNSSLESYIISLESDLDAGAMSTQNTSMTPNTTTNNASLKDIDEKYKQKSLKLQKLINDVFKINVEKIKLKLNKGFFKKWIGRIPSLYQHYSNSARLFENRMKGDPTQILLNEGVNYINEMSARTENIFNEIVTTCKKITSAGDIHAKVNAVKGYCKQYPVEDMSADPKTIKQQIINETCYRIADAILQDNGVYGYTAEGIVQNKKFPTSNHIVTSLFIENAQEKAEEQSVSNIFLRPESLTIFATPERLNVLESSYRMTTNKINANFNPRMISAAQKNMHQNYKLYVNELSRKANAQNATEDISGDINKTKKIVKVMEDGLIDALDIVYEQKKRCIQCVGSMFEMGSRIADLAKRCIAAMYEEEVKNRDNRFKTGASSSLDKSVKRYNRQNAYNAGKTDYQIKQEAAAARLESARNASRYGGRL